MNEQDLLYDQVLTKKLHRLLYRKDSYKEKFNFKAVQTPHLLTFESIKKDLRDPKLVFFLIVTNFFFFFSIFKSSFDIRLKEKLRYILIFVIKKNIRSLSYYLKITIQFKI